MKSLIVVAVPGDEILGCFSVLDSNPGFCDVLFAEPLAPGVLGAVEQAAKDLEYRALFCDRDDELSEDYAAVYVPSRRDAQEVRRLVSARYRSVATAFYHVESVSDRTPSRCLRVWQSNEKRRVFRQTYGAVRPDNLVLRDTETIDPVGCDYSRLTVVAVNGWEVRVPRPQAVLAVSILNASEERGATAEEAFGDLLTVCPTGLVVLRSGSQEFWSV